MDTKKLRQKILDLAIRGKLVPQDPNDEPASVLLERIRAEKERLIKEGKTRLSGRQVKRSKKSASDTPHYENVPFEVPEGWGWCKLIDVCHIFGRIGFRGYTKDDLVSDDGAITLSPSNIIDGQMNYDNCTYISWNKYEESPEIQIANGDILLVKTGSSFGKCAYVCNLPQKATINPQFVVLKHILCNPRFLTYILQSGYARRSYDEFVLGTAIPTFTQVVLGDMYIPFPSLQEQQRIVNVIGQWFKLIDDLEKEQDGLQRIIQQTKSKILDLAIHGKLVPQDPNDEPAIELLKRINPKFTPRDNAHYENLPKGWTVINVGELAQYTNGKAFQPSDWEQRGLPIIRIQNLNDENCKYNYTSIGHEEKYRITNGDLLFAWAASLGVYIWKGDDAWLNQHIFKVEPLPFIDKQFLYYLFQYLISEFYNRSHGSGMVHITKKEFETTIALLPPLSEQQRIVTSIKSYYTILDNISANL